MRAVLALAVLLVACDSYGERTEAQIAQEKACNPSVYGNGVYYFPCAGNKFGLSLSKFLTDFPDEHVSAMSAEPDQHGYAPQGYFVVTHYK